MSFLVHSECEMAHIGGRSFAIRTASKFPVEFKTRLGAVEDKAVGYEAGCSPPSDAKVFCQWAAYFICWLLYLVRKQSTRFLSCHVMQMAKALLTVLLMLC